MITRLDVKRRAALSLMMLVMAITAMAVAGSAAAYACEGTVIHRAAVYEFENGTGFIKNKEIGERVTGPTIENGGASWLWGSESPWVAVNVSGRTEYGWMDINEIERYSCHNPW